MVVFNKNIYQVWFQGCENVIVPEFIENMKNWKLMNPDWNYHCLNDSDLRKMCYSYSKKCGEAYDASQFMHAKIDLGRVVSIYLNGGIMVDMDMFILRSLNSLPEIKEFVESKEELLGVSKLNLSLFESFCFSQSSVSYNNAVMISTKFNSILKLWIDSMVDNILTIKNNGKQYSNNGLYIFDTTGPNLFSKVIQNNIHSGRIVVFDNTIFEPCETVGKCDIKNNTISIHKFEMSWVPKEFRFLTRTYFQYIRPNSGVIITLSVIGLIAYLNKDYLFSKIKIKNGK